MVLEAIDGETIARKILRDDEFGKARSALVTDLGGALARIHALDVAGISGSSTPTRSSTTPACSTASAASSGARTGAQLADRHPRPPPRVARALCTATSASATSSSAPTDCWSRCSTGARPPRRSDGGPRLAVREGLAVRGDPTGGGIGDLRRTFRCLRGGGWAPVDPVVVRWWEVLGTLKWAIMCIVQASVHLTEQPAATSWPPSGGGVRERTRPAGPGRTLVRYVPARRLPRDGAGARVGAGVARPRGVPGDRRPAAVPRPRRDQRARHGGARARPRPDPVGGHERRLAQLGVATDAELAATIRRRVVDDRRRTRSVLVEAVRDKLAVANPRSPGVTHGVRVHAERSAGEDDRLTRGELAARGVDVGAAVATNRRVHA